MFVSSFLCGNGQPHLGRTKFSFQPLQTHPTPPHARLAPRQYPKIYARVPTYLQSCGADDSIRVWKSEGSEQLIHLCGVASEQLRSIPHQLFRFKIDIEHKFNNHHTIKIRTGLSANIRNFHYNIKSMCLQ